MRPAEISVSICCQVIAAEGEQKASKALKAAADIIDESKSALQLRYLQTLNQISAEKNSTIIFPMPVDFIMNSVKGTSNWRSTVRKTDLLRNHIALCLMKLSVHHHSPVTIHQRCFSRLWWERWSEASGVWHSGVQGQSQNSKVTEKLKHFCKCINHKFKAGQLQISSYKSRYNITIMRRWVAWYRPYQTSHRPTQRSYRLENLLVPPHRAVNTVRSALI